MNVLIFDYFVADELDQYVEKTGDWYGAEKKGQQIAGLIHNLINSSLFLSHFLLMNNDILPCIWLRRLSKNSQSSDI